MKMSLGEESRAVILQSVLKVMIQLGVTNTHTVKRDDTNISSKQDVP